MRGQQFNPPTQMGWCGGPTGAFRDGKTVPMILLNKGLDLPPPRGTIREVQ